MRSIGIVGGGHAGLQLGIGLRQRGYAVTIVTDRTPEDVRTGKIMSSQGMQRTALQHERALGLAFWDDLAPKHDFIEFSLGGPGRERAIHWRAPVPGHVGRFPPVVRKPVGVLPSGRLVLGIADVVMLNDPLTGQGSNNASKFAKHYLDRIVLRGAAAFDRAWMQDTFESYWQARGRLTVEWSSCLLLPPSPHMQAIMHAAEQNPAIAGHFAECFDDPPRFFPWLFEREGAEILFGPLEHEAVTT